MKMSIAYYHMVLRYYKKGFYTDSDVKEFVAAKNLTTDEYKQITGKEYGAAE